MQTLKNMEKIYFHQQKTRLKQLFPTNSYKLVEYKQD